MCFLCSFVRSLHFCWSVFFLPRLSCHFIRCSTSWQTNILSNQAFYVYFCNWQLQQRDFNEQKQKRKIFFQVLRSWCGSFHRRRPLKMSFRSMCGSSSTYVANAVWGTVFECVRELFHVKHIPQQATRAHVSQPTSQQPISVYVMCSLLLLLSLVRSKFSFKYVYLASVFRARYRHGPRCLKVYPLCLARTA